MSGAADITAEAASQEGIFRVAVVSASGTGRKRTIPALRDSKLCTVVAIHGRDESRLREIAHTFAIPKIFTDLDAMIADHAFDFAIVCSPPFLHREQVTKLVDAGIPALVEKPLATSIANARAIESLAAARDVPVRVAHHLRHQAFFREITETLRRGIIGQVHRASFEWSFRLNRDSTNAQWKLDPELNAWTPLSDAGVHCVDIAVKLFGAGQVLFANGSRSSRQAVFDDVEVIADHGGIITHIVSSWLYGPSANELYIAGSDGYIVAPEFFTEHSAHELTIASGGEVRTVARSGENAYREEVEDFARTLSHRDFDRGGTSMAEAILALKIIEDTQDLLLRDANS